VAWRTIWSVGTILNVNEMPAHVLVTPSCVAGEFGDVVPFVVRGPSEVHGVHLRATTKCCSAWVVETSAVSVMLAQAWSNNRNAAIRVNVRHSSSWRIGSDVV